MIFQQIETDIKLSMLQKENDIRDALRFLKSKIQQTSKDTREEINDEMVISTIKKFIKQNNETLTFSPANSKKIEAESGLWATYLPKQIVVTKELVSKIISHVGAESIRDMGKVMGFVKKTYGGTIDMGNVSTIVKEKLS